MLTVPTFLGARVGFTKQQGEQSWATVFPFSPNRVHAIIVTGQRSLIDAGTTVNVAIVTQVTSSTVAAAG